jgi:hypothetical protein
MESAICIPSNVLRVCCIHTTSVIVALLPVDARLLLPQSKRNVPLASLSNHLSLVVTHWSFICDIPHFELVLQTLSWGPNAKTLRFAGIDEKIR